MKQYNLLRPVALNELIVGMQILFVSNQTDRHEQLETVIAPANEQGYFVTQGKTGTYYIVPVACYYHNPLAWIEDKPVYKGDVLWYKWGKWSMSVTGYNHRTADQTGFEGIIVHGDNKRNIKGDVVRAPFGNWTWDAPKQKQQAWINISRSQTGTKNRYATKEIALQERGPNTIDTIQIEWEE